MASNEDEVSEDVVDVVEVSEDVVDAIEVSEDVDVIGVISTINVECVKNDVKPSENP